MLKRQKGNSFISWTLLKEDDLLEAELALKSLGPNATLDVLNLGAPLEAVSNTFFPGTSTLHTRFRYVIFVPAAIYAMQIHKSHLDAAKDLENAEISLIYALLAGGQETGVIGRNRKEKLRYRPSATYWTAFNTFNLFGEHSYPRTVLLDQISEDSLSAAQKDEGESSHENRIEFHPDETFWKIAGGLLVDTKKLKWQPELKFDLSRGEAKYFTEKIETLHPRSLYQRMLQLPIREIDKMDSFEDFQSEDPQLNVLIRESMRYSRLSRGITLAYQWALCTHHEKQSKIEGNAWKGAKDIHEKHFNAWLDGMGDLRDWDIEDFRKACEPFNEPLCVVAGDDFKQVAAFCSDCSKELYARKSVTYQLASLAEKVKAQEELIKKNNSRFNEATISVPEGIKAPQVDAYPSPYLFDYRWNQGKANLLDFKRGLGET